MILIACDECGTEKIRTLKSDWIDLVSPQGESMAFCSWACLQSFAGLEAGKAPVP